MNAVVSFLTHLVKVVQVGALIIKEAGELYAWFKRQFLDARPDKDKAGLLLEIAKSVYFAVEAISEITGAKGADKWAIAEKAIPKAAKSAGITTLDPADIEYVKEFISGLAQLNKVIWR